MSKPFTVTIQNTNPEPRRFVIQGGKPSDHFSQEDWMSQLWKQRSGFYVRAKAFRDGEKGITDNRFGNGFYADQYKLTNACAMGGLPF